MIGNFTTISEPSASRFQGSKLFDILDPQDTFTTIDRIVSRGRPKLWEDRRQTMPTETRNDGRLAIKNPNTLTRRVARRKSPLRYSNVDLNFASQDTPNLIDALQDVSADFSAAINYYVRLVNPGDTVQIIGKVPNAEGGMKESPEATKFLESVFERCNETVYSEIPGATGGLHAFIDAQTLSYVTRGAIATEHVLKPNKRDTQEVVTFDPDTVDFWATDDQKTKYVLTQRQVGHQYGVQLNPNLITYKAADDSLYGRSLVAPALRVLPYWMRYWADLLVFLHGAAFNFMDAEFDMELAEKIWANLSAKEKQKYGDSLIAWSLDTMDKVMSDYNDIGVREPDETVGHLSLVKFKSNASAGGMFPVEEARKVLKAEIYTALKIPPVLMGEEITAGSEKLAMLQLETFVSNLEAIRRAITEVLIRHCRIALRASGYPDKVFPEIKWKPIRIADALTDQQSRQLFIQNELRLRDENIQSQNEASDNISGSPAVGPAPLSDNANPDGPSAPSIDVMMTRDTARSSQRSDGTNQSQNGSASGPSFGGDDKQRKTNQEQDKRN